MNPESSEKLGQFHEDFYILSVDVGRLSCETIVCVHKVHPVQNVLKSKLVNIYVLGRNADDKHFERQAIDLKKIIRDFNAREVVIDANGIGVGLLDFMIKPNLDLMTGITFPAYGVFNNKDYQKDGQPGDCEQIIYSLKANAATVNQIHSNCYARINN